MSQLSGSLDMRNYVVVACCLTLAGCCHNPVVGGDTGIKPPSGQKVDEIKKVDIDLRLLTPCGSYKFLSF